MNIFQKMYKLLIAIISIQVCLSMPVLALDLDSTVKDNSRQNYTKPTAETIPVDNTQTNIPQNNTTTAETQEVTETKPKIKQDLPKVPSLPKNANSATVAPLNTEYTGKVPNSDALIPVTNIKTGPLIVDESYTKRKLAQNTTKNSTKTQVQTYRTAVIPKGTQVRLTNSSKIDDYLIRGRLLTFVSTQDITTSYIKLPKGTKFTAKVEDSHRPQMGCNGGLAGLKIVSVQAYGYNQSINAGIIKLKTDDIYFSNLKGEHTYKKSVCKKAKWGQKKFTQWSKTAHNLANKGAGVVIAPFPYIGGCILAAASTVSSPATALLEKGGSLSIPANTAFTIKFYDDAKIRY